MSKLKMQTMNGVQDNIRRLAELFPNCVVERMNANGDLEHAIDFDALRQELQDTVVEGNEERYQFTWPDKRKAKLLANAPINATLRPCREESVDFDNTKNLYIEGDNLDVLKCLKETYLGKVKMIYIDPPYNTGNDFVYEDNFAESAADYLADSGQYDEQGNRLVTNMESNGRFHTKWLNLMYPRLKVARDLLSNDGVIFISMDDFELNNLHKLCNEIFGEKNFQACITWRRRTNQPNDKSKMIGRVAEYILVYAKNDKYLSDNKLFNGVPLSEKRKSEYTNPDNDPNGPWSTNPWKAATGRGGTRYKITTPSGITYDEVWYGNQDTFNKLLECGRVHWTDGGNGVPRIKIYLKDALEEGQAAINWFPCDIYGSNQDGSSELEILFGKKGLFDNPKPTKLLQALTHIASNKDSIVLDFFSGSASTADAVMKLNAEDGGLRSFIMVQINENIEEQTEAYKAGYRTICELGKERIRRAGKKIREDLQNEIDSQQRIVDKMALAQPDKMVQLLPLEEQKRLYQEAFEKNAGPHLKKIEELTAKLASLDTGFRVLKLDSSNMQDVYYAPADLKQEDLFAQADNIKQGRNNEDLLFQVMLELGILLDSKIEEQTIAGKQVFNVADGFLLACFDNEVSDEVITAIAKQQPQYAVLRDSSYADDSTATNFEQIFKTYSPNTNIKSL